MEVVQENIAAIMNALFKCEKAGVEIKY